MNAFILAGLLLIPGVQSSFIWGQAGVVTQVHTPTSASDALADPVPVNVSDQPLTLGARSVYAIDRATGEVLYAKNETEPRPIASITKLATAVTILNDNDLEEVVTVPQLPTYAPDAATLGLQPGQQFKRRDLLAAALIPSANDAADTLAINQSGSVEAFVTEMTATLKKWGITDVQLANPSGLQEGNLASAESVAKMAQLIMHNPTAAEYAQTQQTSISDQSGKAYALRTTDKLLTTGRFYGIKTGYTASAGECFVGLAKVEGHEVITVILGSQDRFGETTTLVNWIEQTYTWQQPH